jgi:hypothetical protein
MLPFAGKKGGKHKAAEESEDEDTAAAADAPEPEFDPVPYQRSVAGACSQLPHWQFQQARTCQKILQQ